VELLLDNKKTGLGKLQGAICNFSSKMNPFFLFPVCEGVVITHYNDPGQTWIGSTWTRINIGNFSMKSYLGHQKGSSMASLWILFYECIDSFQSCDCTVQHRSVNSPSQKKKNKKYVNTMEVLGTCDPYTSPAAVFLSLKTI